MFMELNLIIWATHLGASGDWHQEANTQSEGGSKEEQSAQHGISGAISSLRSFLAPTAPSPPLLSSSHHYLYAALVTCPPWVYSPNGVASLSRAQGSLFLTPLPKGAGRHENTDLMSALWTSHGCHPLAIWD